MTAPDLSPSPRLSSWRGTIGAFWGLAGGFWTAGEQRRKALALLAGLLALNIGEVALFLRFNTWNRDLFDALEQRDAAEVLVQTGVLALIVAGFCAMTSTALLVRRAIALGWRAWLSHRLTMAWLQAGGVGAANPDGRIAEDARVATEEAVELFSSFVNAIITLAIFVGVLWALSSHPPVPVGDFTLAIPGYLLWLALLYAGAGMIATMLAGRPLVRTTDHRQAMEADYRAALVRTRDTGHASATDGSVLRQLFGAVAFSFNRQSGAYARLEIFVCGFTRFGLGLPFLLATPAYLAGVVTLGWVMQAAQAFQTVAGALSWPIAHMPRLATWRASADRVVLLHAMAVSSTAAASGASEAGSLAAAPAARQPA